MREGPRNPQGEQLSREVRPVDAPERRESIAALLAGSGTVLSGQQLADRFGVSRQVIVYDIALLRAQGRDILSTPRGYMMNPVASLYRKTLACSHGEDDIARELTIIVDNGGHVLDVVVEHPLYGDLRGVLMLSSRHDVDSFVARLSHSGARPLSALTGGPHLHTVEARNHSDLARIETELRRAGFLIPDE